MLAVVREHGHRSSFSMRGQLSATPVRNTTQAVNLRSAPEVPPTCCDQVTVLMADLGVGCPLGPAWSSWNWLVSLLPTLALLRRGGADRMGRSGEQE